MSSSITGKGWLDEAILREVASMLPGTSRQRKKDGIEVLGNLGRLQRDQPGQCEYPGCGNAAIGSHSISKGSTLKRLAGKGSQVWASQVLDIRVLMNLTKDGRQMPGSRNLFDIVPVLEPIVIGQASVRCTLCDYHDRRLYKAWDDGLDIPLRFHDKVLGLPGSSGDEEFKSALFWMHHRTLAFEKKLLSETATLANEFTSFVNSRWFNMAAVSQHGESKLMTQLAGLAWDQALRRFDGDLIAGNTPKMMHYLRVLDAPVGIVSAMTEKRPIGEATLNVYPCGTGTWVIVSAPLRKSEKKSRRAMAMMKSRAISMATDTVVKCFGGSPNTYLSNSVYCNMPERELWRLNQTVKKGLSQSWLTMLEQIWDQIPQYKILAEIAKTRIAKDDQAQKSLRFNRLMELSSQNGLPFS